MKPNLFWLSDEQWSRIEPHLPTDVRGKPRVDDRRVISGILHVLKTGCRWVDLPPEYGPSTTIYNRFVRWAERGVWEELFIALSGRGRSTHTQMIDSTHVKAHRSASGGEGGEENQAVGRSRGGRNTKIHGITDAKGRLLSFVLTGGEAHDCPVGVELIDESKPAEVLLADKGYDSAELRQQLEDRGTKAVIPNRSNRKKKYRFDKKQYRYRHRIENAWCRLKDFRRIATRYDKLALVFCASVHLAATIAWWV
jgi:transposase